MSGIEILERIKSRYEKKMAGIERRILICAGLGCINKGALEIHDRMLELIEAAGLDVAVELKAEEDSTANLLFSKTGCQGFCSRGPVVNILPENYLYVKVEESDLEEIIEETLIKGNLIERLTYRDYDTNLKYSIKDEVPYFERQQRSVLKHCGSINPESLHEYVYRGGYKTAAKAVLDMSPKEIYTSVLESGLRGRGGGGILTGIKWKLANLLECDQKYIICNGDEGDSGAFMDRNMLAGNPHAIIEGMIIAGKAIGADRGYIYVRKEYPLAMSRIKMAIEKAKDFGVLGENIFDSSMNFELEVMDGAGAYICGEEKNFLSRYREKELHLNNDETVPEAAPITGHWNKPAVVNNVETLSTIPLIIEHGSDAFKTLGTKTSTGTKTFDLAGDVANTGLIEVSLGTSLRDVISEIGGGVVDDDKKPFKKNYKAVIIGGPSGGCLTPDMLDLKLDFESLQQAGIVFGSGGLLVLNRQKCIVQQARELVSFTIKESCKKCVPCRQGTVQIQKTLDKIISGQADRTTLMMLEELAKTVKKGSLCGVGKTAPNAILSTLEHFKDEYLIHIDEKKCPTGKCDALIGPLISPDICKGCGLCAKKCPVNAISGERKKPYVIDNDKCIKCGICISVCKKFKAIA